MIKKFQLSIFSTYHIVVFCIAGSVFSMEHAWALTADEMIARKNGQVILNEYLASTKTINVNVYLNNPQKNLSIPNNLAIDKRIFGTNLEWFNNAGGLVDSSGTPTNIQNAAQNLKLMRFPGGALSDYYFWENGLGKVADRKSDRTNIVNRLPSTACINPVDSSKSRHGDGDDKGCSKNTFGMPEFFKFLNAKGAEGLISVNIVTGTPNEAKNWLLYANAATATAQRAADNANFTGITANKIKLWEIGNEQYLSHPSCVDEVPSPVNGVQPPSCLGKVIETTPSMTPCQYVGKYNSFVNTMKSAASAVPLEFMAVGVATGSASTVIGHNAIFNGVTPLWATYEYLDTTPSQPSCDRVLPQGTVPPEWNSTVLQGAYSNIDYLAIHNAYFPSIVKDDASLDNENVYKALLAAPEAVDRSLKKISSVLKNYDDTRNALGKNPIGIAITEWGPLFANSPKITRWVDHVKTMGSGIFVARMFQVILQNDRVKIANFFKLTDQTALGWIAYNNINKVPFEVFKLFASKTGDSRIESTVFYSTANASNTIGYKANGEFVGGNIAGEQNVKDVTVFASKTANKVYVNLVNRSGKAKSISIYLDKAVTNVKKSSISSESLTANFGPDYNPAAINTAYPQPDEPAPNSAIVQETEVAMPATINGANGTTKADIVLKPYAVLTIEGSY